MFDLLTDVEQTKELERASDRAVGVLSDVAANDAADHGPSALNFHHSTGHSLATRNACGHTMTAASSAEPVLPSHVSRGPHTDVHTDHFDHPG